MADLPKARMRAIDYDARRDPKTERYCVHCQKDIAPAQSARLARVLMLDGGPLFSMHPDDVHDWQHGCLQVVGPGGRKADRIEDLGWRLLGSTCARRHGMDWTIAEDATTEKPRLLRSGRWRLGPILLIGESPGRWIALRGEARTASDQIGWAVPTMREAAEIAREELLAERRHQIERAHLA